VQVVERVKRWTPAQVAALTADQYAKEMENPEFRNAIDSFEKKPV
jgi:hypothetical protein